jgi:hypothetical protein
MLSLASVKGDMEGQQCPPFLPVAPAHKSPNKAPSKAFLHSATGAVPCASPSRCSRTSTSVTPQRRSQYAVANPVMPPPSRGDGDTVTMGKDPLYELLQVLRDEEGNR